MIPGVTQRRLRVENHRFNLSDLAREIRVIWQFVDWNGPAIQELDSNSSRGGGIQGGKLMEQQAPKCLFEECRSNSASQRYEVRRSGVRRCELQSSEPQGAQSQGAKPRGSERVGASPLYITDVTKPYKPISPPRVLFATPMTPKWIKAAELLKFLGIEVEMMPSGRECVDRILSAGGASPFHAIIASLELEDLDGFSVVSLLRENKCRLPAVTLSSHQHYDFEELSLNVGSGGHFTLRDLGELGCFITSVSQLEMRVDQAA